MTLTSEGKPTRTQSRPPDETYTRWSATQFGVWEDVVVVFVFTVVVVVVVIVLLLARTTWSLTHTAMSHHSMLASFNVFHLTSSFKALISCF